MSNANVSRPTSVIASGTTGTEVALGAYALSGVVVPASMAGTSLVFEVSIDNGATWLPLRDESGARVTVVIQNTAAFHSLRRVLPLSVGLVRPVSSASETAKTLTLIGQRIV